MSSRSLKDKFNTKTIKEIISKDTLNYDNEIYSGEYGDFLRQKSYELTLINAKGALALGKIFEEVYQTLGKENGEGIYLEWLKSNNFNRTTAWRYKQKYNLYLEVSSEKGKEIVALLPFRLISEICQHEQKDTIIELLNTGSSLDEIKCLLAPIPQKIEDKYINQENIFNLETFNFEQLELNIKNNYNSLDEKDKKEAAKLLEKLLVLFNKEI